MQDALIHKAARGALWTVIASIFGRTVGVLGTLLVTRFLRPDTMGEVSDAVVVAMTANWVTSWGFGQYVVVNARADARREVIWHATVFQVGLGALSLGAIALFGGGVVEWFDAPGAARFVPGMALAMFVRRLGAIPERILMQRMDFRASGLVLFIGEVVYTIVAVSLVVVGCGGNAIVIGNVAQSVVVVAILVRAVGLRNWITPTRFSLARVKAMLAFGVPLGLQGIAHNASRYWDNLAVSHFFGTTGLGRYNLAYNLADITATQVGEQVTLVLLPSMAELPRDRRPAALERATALLALVIFPLAIGLGVIAHPLVAALLPANDWQDVAPLLQVLAVLSVFRPITWVLSAYMEAEGKTGRLMFLEVGKLVVLLGGIAMLAPFGLRAASGAVGIAFALTAVAGIAMVGHSLPAPGRLLAGFGGPLVASAVMVGACQLAKSVIVVVGFTAPVAVLVAQIGVGAVTYVGVAFLVCGTSAHDLLGLVRRAVRRSN